MKIEEKYRNAFGYTPDAYLKEAVSIANEHTISFSDWKEANCRDNTFGLLHLLRKEYKKDYYSNRELLEIYNNLNQ